MLIAFPLIAFSQFTLSGKVCDKETNETIPSANVRLENSWQVSSTDASGCFSITKLKKNNYQILISYVGYKTYSENIEVDKDIIVTIKLEKTSLLQDEVIISATKADNKSATTFKNIDKKEIKEINLGKDLPYLISSSPSTVVTSDAGAGVGYTGIRIRGSDITRINVTVNGIPINDPESQGVYWVNMPDFASSIDNIQIQRGVGTSTNGAAAFGASINIQTLKLNPEPYAEINSSYGSYNTSKNTFSVGTGLINKKFSFDGRLSKLYSDGYIDRAFSDLKSFYVSGSYYGNKSILKLNIFSGKERTYQAWYGVPKDSLATNRTYNPYTFDNQTDNYQQDHYQLIYSKELFKNLNVNAALHYTRGRGYYEEFRENDDFANYNLNPVIIGNDTITSSNLIRQRWLDNNFYGITYSANYDNQKKLKLTIGGAYNIYDGDHFGKVIWAEFASNTKPENNYYLNNGKKKDFNIFGKGLYQITKKLSGFIDVQFRNINYSFIGYDNDLVSVDQNVILNFINPKAGLNFDFNSNNSIYASYSIGNKEPNRDDYVQSSVNSRPKPENLKDIEIGFKNASMNKRFNINCFYMDYQNQLVLTGKINDVGEYTRTNISKSYRAGIEFDGSIRIIKYLILSANGAYSINKIKDFTEYIDNFDDWSQSVNNYKETDIAFSPSIIAGGNLNYSPLKNLDLNFGTKYIGKQYLDNTSNKDRMINAFNVSDFRISYIIKTKLIKEIGLSFIINNIFDTKYESNGWTYSYISGGNAYTENYYYPQALRNYMIGINFKF
ncbi:MAG: TonB-dependent receptor [Bacteroidetes bacterium]|nr:TonB-dependent receptor [Bacteroidota bacterium]